MELLKEYFQNNKVKSVLDVGTGTGDFIEVLTGLFPGAAITGIDPNSESLNRAEERYPKFSFIKMSGERIGFGENTFDIVSISMALHHLTNPVKTLREMQRVVKPGGRIIINELFSDSLNLAQKVHRLYHHFGSHIDRVLGITHNQAFKKSEIFSIVEQAGITVDINFEYEKQPAVKLSAEEINIRTEKMKTRLESIKNSKEYEQLEPQIKKFREDVVKYGFQPANRILIVGRTKKRV